MFKEFALVILLAAVCLAQHGHDHQSGASYFSFNLGHDGGLGGSSGGSGGSSGHGHDHHDIDYHSHAKYEFKYGVADGHTHDHHNQHEVRDGDTVHGEYSLHEPDGTIRIVKYTADKKNGFNAQVIRKGHAVHPEVTHKGHFVHYGGGEHGHY